MQTGGNSRTRIPPGQSDGYLKGFATLCNDAADLISGTGKGQLLPRIDAGMDGMWFIDACIRSSKVNGGWVAR